MTNKELSAIDAYSEMRNLKASVGGYFGGYYEVEIDFDSKELKWEHRGDGEVDYYAKTIRQNTSDKFINELRDLGLLRWKKEYSDPLFCDGTQWEIEVIGDKKSIRIYGDNQYPEEWDRFCRLIRKISGKNSIKDGL